MKRIDRRDAAEIEWILTENARLLGEAQNTFLRLRPDGSVRIQVKVNGRWVRYAHKDYQTLASARWAAGVALSRAQAIAASREESA